MTTVSEENSLFLIHSALHVTKKSEDCNYSKKCKKYKIAIPQLLPSNVAS
jgi:hypothetical protein